ncbi:MAG: hypothetical protein ACRDZ3_19990 [Acidimicrobiia bacterium]
MLYQRAAAMTTDERALERSLRLDAWAAAACDPDIPAAILAAFERELGLLALGDEVDAASGSRLLGRYEIY